MIFSSKIGSDFRKRKRVSFLRKWLYYVIFLIFFITLGALFLTWQKVRVWEISVSGNSSVSKEEILDIVESKLSERYLGFIPTDNFLLIKRFEIKDEIKNDLKKIESATLSFNNLNSIEITVTEREAKYLWCDKNCYFMDKTGFIFTDAPDFDGDVFIKFYGDIKDNPIGQNFINGNFLEISNFIQGISDAGLLVINFKVSSIGEYEINLENGGKILLNDKENFEKYLLNINALIENNYLKVDEEFLKKLDYIDLRFGNKVPIKMRI